MTKTIDFGKLFSSVQLGDPVPRFVRCVKCGREAPADYWHQSGTYYCNACELRAPAEMRLTDREQMLESIPARYRWACAQDPLSDEMLERIGEENTRKARHMFRELLEGGTHWITLYGESGAGKTTLAAAFLTGCADMIKQRERGRCALQLGDLARSRFFHSVVLAKAKREHRLGYPEPSILERVRDAPIAVIDDLGSEDAHAEILSEILQHRHANDLGTIVTTGLTVAQIQADRRYGEVVARRLFEGGVAVGLERV